ncbi:MAG TPA: hypothetical protein VGM90_03425 [Kofleriaceae bacterium]
MKRLTSDLPPVEDHEEQNVTEEQSVSAGSSTAALPECARAYVDARPAATRDAWTQALARFHVECDDVERLVRFYPPSDPAYLQGSYVSFAGALSSSKSAVWLSFEYQSDSWLFADQITVAADEYRWKSGRQKFKRDFDESGVTEGVLLDYGTALRAVVDKIVHAKDSTVRFYGTKGYIDVHVTGQMADDLRVMDEAVRTLHPH